MEILTTKQLSDIKKLRTMAQKKADVMEYRNVTLKGVKNLSRSDIDDVIMTCNSLIQTGHTGINAPFGEVRDVFATINITFN